MVSSASVVGASFCASRFTTLEPPEATNWAFSTPNSWRIQPLPEAMPSQVAATPISRSPVHLCCHNSGTVNPGSFLPISASSSDDPIVGMWHVTFTAEGNELGPPDGTRIYNALVVWHSDGTEIMGSARPVQDGDICLGIRKKAGKSRYKLNHLPWMGNDTANAPSGIGNPSGPTQIVEEVTLSPDGKHYTGTFTLDAYDPSGNQVAHIVGAIRGTRVTVDTKVSDLI